MHSPDLRQLAVSTLIVDSDVQRSLDPRRVDKIVAEFNWDAVGTLTVSNRTNGTHHVIDGQHRAAAIRLVEGEMATVMCRVFVGLTLAEEAEMFRLLNNTAKPQAIDLFRVRVIEGDPAAVDIVQILKENGWTVSSSANGAHIAAVSALERIYRRDPEALGKAVATTGRAWGHDTPANDGRLVEGLGLVFARYEAAVDVAELVPRLAKLGGGPGALLGKAKGLSQMIGCPQPQAVAEIVVEVFNKGRKTRALPPWRTTH